MATLVVEATAQHVVFAAVAEEVGRSWRSTSRSWSATTRTTHSRSRHLDQDGRLAADPGRPTRIDYSDVSGVIGQVAAQDWALRTSIGVPIVAESRLWGCMIVAFSGQGLLPLPVPVELEVTTHARCPEPVEVAAHYVVSEALANAMKHAQASRVEISLGTLDGSLLLSIRDDGVGGADPGRGSGLAGLTDRAEALGGSIRLHTAAGAGTHITVDLPLGYELAQSRPVPG